MLLVCPVGISIVNTGENFCILSSPDALKIHLQYIPCICLLYSYCCIVTNRVFKLFNQINMGQVRVYLLSFVVEN